ncbi:TPA: hypothetical protein ACJEU7_003009 [Acinetobacter baumannii]|uniref:hypothetical protein n=1 Tax=Acinetobacter baumannii TaxID=470 RepID=UPI00224E6331|nr:hypothetical protein [Acinetobacter baumannii]MCX3035232.1 hypothetical protein [Acinetobacter baumannii]
MTQQNMSWRNALIVACISVAVVIVALGFYFAFKYQKENQANLSKDQEIKVKYDGNDPEVKDFIEKNTAYQRKVTSFDESLYEMPVANLASQKESNKCVNGFGGEMNPISKGVFDEPLYALDAETLPTDGNEVAYSPYVNSYYVVGDILFKKPLDLFDRKLITLGQLTRNFSDIRTIIGGNSFKSSYVTMESKFGFPQSYMTQQSGLVVGLSAFNDGCIKGVGKRNIVFDRVDLSGIPVVSLLSAKYKTSLYHGVNGLYNYTAKTPDYVSLSFLNWVHSNNLVYQKMIQDGQKHVFPKGAYLYVPVKYDTKEEIVSVDFKSEPIPLNLSQIKANIAKDSKLRESDVDMIKEPFSDYVIYKPVSKMNGARISQYAFAEKAGKFYLASWEEPESISVSPLDPNRSNLALLNKAALKSTLELLKSNYQGDQFDVGTSNEDVDLNFTKMKSQEGQQKMKEKEAAVSAMFGIKPEQDNKGDRLPQNYDLSENTIKQDQLNQHDKMLQILKQ